MSDESLRGGIVLAGGFSVRFGSADKAVADLADEAMITRVARRVDEVVDELVINCREEQAASIRDALDPTALAYRFAFDSVPDRGPLAGIEAGIVVTDAPYVAVLSCDTPFVEPALLEYLFERAAGRDGAVPILDGEVQPTQAVYRAEAMANACRESLAADQHSIRAALEHIDWVAVNERDVRERASLESFESVETTADLERAERRLSE